MTHFDMTGKKAIITGANNGMGLAMTKAFMASGATVAMLDLNESVVETANSLCTEEVKAYGVAGDVSNMEGLKAIFEKALAALGGEVDILINCAGVSLRGDCEDYSIQNWEKTMSINSTAVYYMSQLAGNEMLKKGSGKIINMASMMSFYGGAKNVAYAASKGSVAQITKSCANAWGAQGINVNALAPGWIETNLTAALRQNTAKTENISSRIPMVRWGTPEDVVGPALFLASEASNYVNGIILPVDGGYLAY